jgi:hypothetical protein
MRMHREAPVSNPRAARWVVVLSALSVWAWSSCMLGEGAQAPRTVPRADPTASAMPTDLAKPAGATSAQSAQEPVREPREVKCGNKVCADGCCQASFPCATHPDLCGGDFNGWTGKDECISDAATCKQAEGAYLHLACDGPEDCGAGQVCCYVPSEKDRFRSASCKVAGECSGSVQTEKGLSPRKIACRQHADCPATAKCNQSMCDVPAPPRPEPRVARSVAECKRNPTERAVLTPTGSLACVDFPLSSNEPPQGCLLCNSANRCPSLMCPYGEFCNTHRGEISVDVSRVAPGMGCCECDSRTGRQ